MLSYCCGLCVSELASLRVTDFVNAEGELNDVVLLTAEQTKGSDSRRVFLSKRAKATLNRFFNSDLSVMQQSYLFQTRLNTRFNTNALTLLAISV